MEPLAQGYGLIEGPVWVPGRGLLFSDVHHGGVFCLGTDGEVSTVFEHRRGIGGMALHEAGGMVVGGRNIGYKPFAGGDTVTLLDRDPEHGNVGYNDLTTDEAGRIYAGSLGSPVFEEGEQQPGNLYLIDLDGTSRIVGRDILLTNGLGLSPDGSTLYHSRLASAKGVLLQASPRVANSARNGSLPHPTTAHRTALPFPRMARCGSRWQAAAASTSTNRTAACASTSGFPSPCAPASASAATALKTFTSSPAPPAALGSMTAPCIAFGHRCLACRFRLPACRSPEEPRAP